MRVGSERLLDAGELEQAQGTSAQFSTGDSGGPDVRVFEHSFGIVAGLQDSAPGPACPHRGIRGRWVTW